MEKVRYMISDAANLVHVEAHVLRYWEEELELAIPRNEMGHRYYTRENIQEFQKIKDLKEKGYQLKAIRMILHNGEAGWNTLSETDAAQSMTQIKPAEPVRPIEPVRPAEPVRQAEPARQMEPPKSQVMPALQKAAPALNQGYQEMTSPEERMAQFRELMSDIVGHAIALNNEELSQTISKEVGEQVLKEMNYLAREQEEAQEERYKKLDAAIRGNIRRKKTVFSKDKPEKKLSRKEKKKAAKMPKPATT